MGFGTKRWKETKHWQKTFTVVTVLSTLLTTAIGTQVTHITPNEGSLQGETRITIYGNGFSKDNFNNGNEVNLVSDKTVYSCRVHKDGTLEDRIMCYTPPGMIEDTYYVRLTVDSTTIVDSDHCGSATSWKCRFKPRSANTPTITSVEPTSGPPGTILTIRGKLFSDRYGSNIAAATNGKTEKILRVYGADQECSLKAANDVFYGLSLDNDNSDYGTMKCKLNGKFIANNNASFIIEGKYGRSLRSKDVLHQYSNGDLALFQTYAEVVSVSPACGSTEGGTLLTITGHNFDDSGDSLSKNTVVVGGAECKVVSVTETEITCKTSAPTQTGSSFPGNRGLLMEVWNSTTKSYSNIAEISELNDTVSGYTKLWTHQTFFEDENWVDFVSRMRGYFVAPKTGEYSFHIMSDDTATLLLSNSSNPDYKSAVATSSGYSNSYNRRTGQGSSRINLTQNERYYMEILHTQNSGGAHVKVGARFYDTDITNTSTGMANQEIQQIKISSTILREIQNITVAGFSAGSSTSEVQEISVLENSGQLTSAAFQLGLYDVYTVPLTTSSSDTEVLNALNELPALDTSAESVEVSLSQPSTGMGVIINVKFISPRGDFPNFQFKLNSTNGSPLTITITEKAKGTPSGEYFTLSMANVPSPLISAEANAATVKSSLMSMFGTRCPKVFGNPSSKKFHYSFEDTSLPSGIGGQRHTEMEAFCGKASVLNPNFLFNNEDNPIDLTQQFTSVCFAHYGQIQDRISVTFSYLEGASEVSTDAVYTFDNTFDQSSSEWRYNCVNLYDALKTRYTTGSFFSIKRLQIFRVDSEVFVDEVMIGKTKSDSEIYVKNRRMLPSKPNNALIEDAIVNKYTVNGNPVYEVKLIPLDCGYNFPKFSSISGQLKSGSSITVVREQTASPPMSGTFTVTYKGTTKSGISCTLDGPGLGQLLQNSIPEMGDIYVYRHGDCANYFYNIAFLSKPGDLESITVSSQLSGIDAAIVAETVNNGSLWFNPIQGDMLQTWNSVSQAVVYVNGIRTKCSGSCEFDFRSDCTPTVTAVSPSSGIPSSTEITITGTKFDSTHTNNNVTIGGVECTTKSATTTQIVCDVGSGPAGVFPVEVDIVEKGKASVASGATFTYQFQVSSTSPSTGSLGGGISLTLTGYGFSSADLVNIGGNNCPITSFASTEIICTVPAVTAASTEDINVLQNGTNSVSSGHQFTYSTSGMAVITSATPSSSSVGGGDILTIIGNNFDTSGSLKIGGKDVTPSMFTSTEVRATLPDLPAGTHAIQLNGNLGRAVLQSSNQVPTIDYQLKLQDVYPTRGSILGGTRVTLSGQGFPTDKTITEVKFGQYNCDIQTQTNTRIECIVADTGNVNHVDNWGTHYVFGQGYAWNPSNLQIAQGDMINWQWSYPNWLTRMTPRVFEVRSELDMTAVENGFDSGAATTNGVYRHRFNIPGTYYFWTGYIEPYETTSFLGSVTVTNRQSTAELVSVKVLGKYEAVHEILNSLSSPSSSSGCTGTVQPDSSCQVTEPTGSDATKFYFKFWECSTPTVTGININNGTTEDSISLEGTMFSSTKCRNEVKFGNMDCQIQSATSSSLSCSIDPSNTPDIGAMQEVEMKLNNLGNARVDISGRLKRSFTLIPVVTKIDPAGGSTKGGTAIEIEGSGFKGSVNDVRVTIGSYDCTVTNVTYTRITCINTNSAPGSSKVKVQVKSPQGVYIDATFKVDDSFVYTSTFTPVLTGVTPASISGTSTTLTIGGQKFGTTTANVAVKVGSEDCSVTAVSDTAIECSISYLPVGSNQIEVNVNTLGLASGTISVTSDAVVTSISPAEGSTNGGTLLSIQGNGFVSSTTVTVDGTSCPVQSVSLSQVTCLTPAHVAGTVSVAITANSVSYPSQNFSYDAASTPEITSISPTSGSAGTLVTLNGQKFDSNPTVTIGNVACTVSSSTATNIICEADSQSVGTYSAIVNVPGKGSSNEVNFEYLLAVSSVNPSSGSEAGDQTVTIVGSGFDTTTTATICGGNCVRVSNTASEFVCKTPASSGTSNCDIVVTENAVSKTLTSGYTYDAAKTPTITSVSPTRGGTGGGTLVTIAGSGFGIVSGDVDVTIDGTTCVISTITASQIVCATGPNSQTVKSKVRLEKSGNGIAAQDNAGFEYVDLWSSIYTWNGSLPTEGDLVVIKKGQTILLDTDTPILKTLLIQGGALIFDEKDVELNAEIILVLDDGLFQIGTEDAPFQHKAIVTLHGHHRSKELPIYGTKVLAIREGRLELHGKRIERTWTKLASTAAAGSTTIALMEAVPDWSVGDEIIIATTGNMLSQGQNEKRTIQAISGTSITLTEPLVYEHLGVTITADGRNIDTRAEVGLLTHNVVVRGNSAKQWVGEIEACEAGFDPGEFATQTCFQGKHGAEMGSDQFGSQIILHADKTNENKTVAGHIEFVEVNHAGQAFRLGRYPIHFHLNGYMPDSYVRGCSIHETFNRAVNIHGTHNLLVEHNVIYNIMGGAFFLEDGIETGNTLQYNLAVFVRESSSLLNDDVTPASFWITNPNNTVQHNSAAGGTHFGFWYRMLTHPDGPSFTTDVCPREVPLGVFQNNTAHSFGWFGLWLFEVYTPRTDPCNSNTPEPAKFYSLTAWNCEKGAEWVFAGPIQCIDFVMVNNEKAGIEGKKILEGEFYTDKSPMVKDSLIVGHMAPLTKIRQGCTVGGIVLPYGHGMVIDGVTFVNFDESNCQGFTWTRIDGTCNFLCGGYQYNTQNLKWVNSPNKGQYDWLFEGIIKDLDGTLVGDDATSIANSVGKVVLPATGTLPPTCVPFSKFSQGIPAVACPATTQLHRFAFNNVKPSSLNFKNVIITNQYGNSSTEYADKRISHPQGWMMGLLNNEEYTLTFENAEHIVNISYNGDYSLFNQNDYIIMRQKVNAQPDRFSIDGNTHINSSTIDPATSENGDWEYDSSTKEVRYMIVERSSNTGRKKRSTGANSKNFAIKLSAYKCIYENCEPPPDPSTLPPATARSNFTYWSQNITWKNAPAGWGGNFGNGSYGLPEDGDDVQIIADTWVVADIVLPSMNKLVLYGVLELDDQMGTVDHVLNCTYIIIMGGRLIVGWPDRPYPGNALILLRGSHQTADYPISSGPAVRKKAIGVFGGLDLHGKDVQVPWTKLSQTGNIGDSTITVADPVDWSVNDLIVIAPTGMSAWQTEVFKITAKSADNMTLTLNSSLLYTHLGNSETVNGMTFEMKAEVGLLTRNVRIEGQDYANLYSQSYGARVVIGRAKDADTWYTGYARLSNVEFYHTGQEGYIEPYDAAFSVAFIDAGTVSTNRPSFVKKCAFHHGFSPAVGVFGLNGLSVEDNVIHHTVYSSIMTNSDNTQLRRNLVVLTIFEGTYQDRHETTNVNFKGAFETFDASNLILEGNHVAGAERLCYHVHPEPCTSVSTYFDNVCHTTLTGIGVFPGTDTVSGDCVRFSNFTIYKAGDYGIYANLNPSLIVEDVKIADSGVGVFPIIMGPAALSHAFSYKSVIVRKSLFIAMSSSFDCTKDKLDLSDANIALSEQATPHMGRNSHFTGVAITTFTSGSNESPKKPWSGTMSYQSLMGVTQIEDVTFADFNRNCNGKSNYAISPNKKNDDVCHPTQTRRLTFVNTDDANKILIHRPNVGKINSADCVDMDCDALKKTLIRDEDGTLLGSVGAVISQSEFEWDTNPRRGLGDYRIPKEMLTTIDGNKIDIATFAPNKGIIRDSQCVYVSAWQAYKCPSSNYRMMTVESMDHDTETRRLSPIALKGDNYIDLVNGPQDHGWCSGYTCRKRLSTFPFLVLIGKEYLMHYTSVAPQDSRIYLLNAASSDAVVVAIWHSQPSRKDVYYDGEFVWPSNGREAGTDKRYVLDPPPPGQPDYYKPNASDPSPGNNYFDRDTNILYITVQGSKMLEIKTKKTFIISLQFPPMTADEFYGEEIVHNFAAFFNIAPGKVRVASIVYAQPNAGKRRKKRSTTNTITGITIEVADGPTQYSNGTNSGDLTSVEFDEIQKDVINEIQLGNLSEKINCSLETTFSVAEVLPDTSEPSWTEISSNTDSPYVVIEQADKLVFRTSIVPMHEGVAFPTQPKIRVLNVQGNPISKLGSTNSPWEVTATLRSSSGTNPNAKLEGNLTTTFVNGWANFTGLLITHFGSGYIIDFNITNPVEGENLTISSDPLEIPGRPIKAAVVTKTADVISDSYMTVTLELRDEVTAEVISDIAWRGHTWNATAELGMPELYNGTLGGTTSEIFDTANGQAAFYTLKLSNRGAYVVKFRIMSDPPDYDFYYEELVTVKAQSHIGLQIDETQQITLRFNDDYETIVGTTGNKYFAAMMGSAYANKYTDVLVNNVNVYKGSIVVTFVVSGSLTGVNTTVYAMCSSIQNGQSYTYNGNTLTLSSYMLVGGNAFYGVACATDGVTTANDDSSVPIVGIVVGVLAAIIVLLIVMLILLWKYKIHPKTRTADLSKKGYLGNQDIDEILWREKTFMSIREKTNPIAPAATIYDKKHLY